MATCVLCRKDCEVNKQGICSDCQEFQDSVATPIGNDVAKDLCSDEMFKAFNLVFGNPVAALKELDELPDCVNSLSAIIELAHSEAAISGGCDIIWTARLMASAHLLFMFGYHLRHIVDTFGENCDRKKCEGG